MPDTLKSPAVYTPKSIGEIVSIKKKSPSAIFMAGGTYLMSRPGYYVKEEKEDIILLSGIMELSRVQHTDRFFDAGSMLTISQLLQAGSYILSPSVYKALSNISTSLIRNQATIGGALCCPDTKFELAGILSTIHAQAELRIINSHKLVSRWVSVSKLYEADGSLAFDKDIILTKIRIPAFSSGNIQIFRTVGSPMHDPTGSVFMGLSYSMNQTEIASPTLCLVFPKGGFFLSTEVDNALSQTSLPIDTLSIKKLSKLLEENIKDICKNASELQIERAKRLLETVLYDINTSYLAG